MPSKSKSSSKADSGCVGYCCGGVMKAAHVRVFHTEESDLSEVYNDFQQHYGKSVELKFVYTTTPQEHFEKFMENLTSTDVGGSRIEDTNLFKDISTSQARNSLKDVTNAKEAKTYPLKKDTKDTKAKKSDSDDEGEEKDEKPVKKGKGGKTKKETKKEDSDDEKSEHSDESEHSEEDDDDKPKKKNTKSKKEEAKKQSDNEKDSDDEDEGPKLKKKTDKSDKGDKKESKSSKSKSKSK